MRGPLALRNARPNSGIFLSSWRTSRVEHDEQPHRRARDHVRCALPGHHQCDLAEVLAGAEGGDDLSAPDDVDLALLDEVQVIAEVSRVGDLGSCLGGLFRGDRGDVGPLLVIESREHVEGCEPGWIHLAEHNPLLRERLFRVGEHSVNDVRRLDFRLACPLACRARRRSGCCDHSRKGCGHE